MAAFTMHDRAQHCALQHKYRKVNSALGCTTLHYTLLLSAGAQDTTEPSRAEQTDLEARYSIVWNSSVTYFRSCHELQLRVSGPVTYWRACHVVQALSRSPGPVTYHAQNRSAARRHSPGGVTYREFVTPGEEVVVVAPWRRSAPWRSAPCTGAPRRCSR